MPSDSALLGREIDSRGREVLGPHDMPSEDLGVTDRDVVLVVLPADRMRLE